ncbi:MAG: GerMN domain-containing protein [Leptospiraceae bacterium]|nr:GerMN domain-containing protein [Leptospiraceae bacterium]
MSGNPGAPPAESMSVEQSNRIVLILAGLLLLLVFMDVQAGRHYQAVSDTSGQDPVEYAGQRAAEVQESILRPIQGSAEEILQGVQTEATDSGDALLYRVESGADSVQQEAQDQINTTRRNVEQEAREGISATGEAIRQEAHQQLDDRLDRVLPQNRVPDSALLYGPMNNSGHTQSDGRSYAADLVETDSGGFDLYYLRFQNGRTRLVRVRRDATAGPVSLTAVLAHLQRGPLLRERGEGLLNNFDGTLEPVAVRIEGDLAIINASTSIARMSNPVISDRLDQIVYTLTQFPRIRGVVLEVNGRRVHSLGRDGFIVPPVMTRTNREVIDF